jgi:CDP-glucose 4,6-dehydratase
VAIDPDFWRDRRVLITGHTGFKGAWLSLWLQSLGAELTGLSRGVPSAPSLYEMTRVGESMREVAVDVRDERGVREALVASGAEIVVHLAAQPVVRRSLADPALTYEINVMGTVNVLEAVRQAGSQVRAVLVVTSDKCYENSGEHSRRYRESDPLGGEDPYSSSKACAELVSAAYRRSFFAGQDTPRLATARAGNVIGGGDWGEDRLLPDAVRALEAGRPLLVRNPHAVRPWQHVINPLGGYLLLVQALYESVDASRAWNFGPRPGDAMSVEWIVRRLSELWRGELRWESDARSNPPEAVRLELDSGDSERELGWRPALGLGLERALGLFVDWQAARGAGEDMRLVTLGQIERHGFG